ncbi:AAA family ATPase [Myxococcota bacterium]|nr:AAA family ATPase [Myxococcota bacterium]
MRFVFGRFELDADRFELRRAGELVAIQPKVLELVLFLVHHRDRAVGADELLRVVWPETAVTRSSLARAVSLARRAIDDGDGPSAIRTVARRGYRFEGEVSVAADAPAIEEPSRRYVGRTAILARVRAALDAALAGRGGILLLVGEAGIGKTRTAELLCDQARSARAEVVPVWSLTTGAPTYSSWTRILSQLVTADPQALATLPRSQRGVLAALLPEASAAPAPLRSSSTETARFALYDAVRSLLVRVAHTRPLLIVLDDLHAADAESIALLEFVGRSLASLPIAVVATAREADVALAPQQLQALERLLRLGGLERWPLTGLDDADLHEFVVQRLGREPAPELVAALERQTGGNPLLLGESLRSLEARELLGTSRTRSEWESLLPRGIEHLLRPKLRPLAPAVLETLAFASAIGLELDRKLLAACRTDTTDLAAQLEALLAAGLLSAGASPGRLRFSHALVREAIYQELVPEGAPRRALHARIFAALEAGAEALSPAVEGVPGESARHACEAVPLVAPLRAAELARKSAEQAARLHDFEGAASRYARGLAVLPQPTPESVHVHAALLLGLADAQVRTLGLERARASYLAAAEMARACGRADRLARAALGLAQRPNSSGQEDPEVTALLEESLRALPRKAVALRTRVTSRLAAELRYSERPRSLALADRALAAARRQADPMVLAETLEDCTFMQWSPSDPAAWIALNAEVAKYARAADDLDLAISGHKGCVSGALELGDLARAEREIRACERIAREVPTPYSRWWCAVLQAARAGRRRARDRRGPDRRVAPDRGAHRFARGRDRAPGPDRLPPNRAGPRR